MTLEEEAFDPGFCFLRAGSGANAKGEVGSFSAGRFAGADVETTSCQLSAILISMRNVQGALDASIAIIDS
jgi:hypothetical protein